MDIVHEQLISHSLLEWTSEGETVTATVRENFTARTGVTCGSTNTDVPGDQPCPDDDIFLAGALENGEIYNPAVRDVTEVRPRKGNNGCWSADFEQWLLVPAIRAVKFDIPKEFLATTEAAELIAWGQANGKLLPAVI